MSRIVIASRLSDGIVVFLSKESTEKKAVWALQINAAALAEDDARADALLAIGEASAAEIQDVVDPYLIDVVEEAGQLRPTKYREAIRALGPTNRTDLGKQSEGAGA